jgi:hypothetical protein
LAQEYPIDDPQHVQPEDPQTASGNETQKEVKNIEAQEKLTNLSALVAEKYKLKEEALVEKSIDIDHADIEHDSDIPHTHSGDDDFHHHGDDDTGKKVKRVWNLQRQF